jgi:hypothetical protein
VGVGDAVEAEVRELVRRRGLALLEDQLAMRGLVDELVSDYAARPHLVPSAAAGDQARGHRVL